MNDVKNFLLCLFIFLWCSPSYGVCPSSAVMKSENGGKLPYLIMDGHAKIHFLGVVDVDAGKLCVYSYSRSWGGSSGRVSNRLIFSDRNAKIYGMYVIDVLEYVGVVDNDVVAVTLDKKRERIGFSKNKDLPKSIFFDGDNFDLIKP